MKILTIDAAVGRRIRELRMGADVQQEFLALVARRWGLAWSRPQVAWIESGRRKIQLAEFLVLPAILSEALGVSGDPAKQITYKDLMPRGHETVTLTKELSADPGGTLQRLMELEGCTKHKGLAGTIEDLDEMLKRPTTKHLELQDELSAKAAGALNITTEQVVELAKLLWNRAFSDERDQRFKDRHSGQQLDRGEAQGLRSHITRELMAELRAHLKKSSQPTRRQSSKQKGGRRTRQRR